MGVMNSLTPDLEKVFENSNMQEHTSFFTGKRLTVNPVLGGSVDTKLFSIIVDTRLVGAWWCTWIDHWRLHGSQNWTKKHTSFEQYLHFHWDTLSGKLYLQFDVMLKRPRIACILFDTFFSRKPIKKTFKF